MTRKAVWVCIPYMLGLFYAVTLTYFTDNSPKDFLAALLITPFVIIIGIKIINTKAKLILVLLSFLIGFWCYNLYVINVAKPLEKLSGQTIRFNGKITEMSETKGDRAMYIFQGKTGNRKITVQYFGEELVGDYGDKITADITLSEIIDKYTFPAKKYYNSKNILLRADTIENVRIDNSDFSLLRELMQFRQKLIKQFKYVLDGDELGICIALLLGDTSLIDEDVTVNFHQAGISHVTSVSGFHLVLVTGILVFFFKKIRLNRKVSFGLTVTILCVFSALTGFPIAMIRSLIMCIIWLSAEMFKRQSDLLNSLCIAVIFMTVTTPYVFTNTSFLLSITGVFAIGVVAPYLTQNLKGFIKPFAFMGVISIVIMPVTMLFFDYASLSSPIANVLITPLLSFACILLAISGFICLFGFFAYPLIFLAGLSCKLSMFLLSILNHIPMLPIGNDNYKYTMILFIGFILIICAYNLSIRNCAKGIFACTAGFLLVIFVFSLSDNQLKVKTFGKTTVISKGSYADIIDGGGNLDYKSVLQYLSENNITKINTLYFVKNEQYLYGKYRNTDYKKIIVRKEAFIGNLKGDIIYINNGYIIRYNDYEIELSDEKDEPFKLKYRG
jgi:ComEC/Rec2-related protein